MSAMSKQGERATIREDVDPMLTANSALRCRAKPKRTGQPCRALAVSGRSFFRMHDARGGAKAGSENPRWKHSGRSAEAVTMRKFANQKGREFREPA